MIMENFLRFLIKMFDSWGSALAIVIFCIASFYWGERTDDMNLFASSGGLMTVFGILSTVRFSTMEKYLEREAIIRRSTGLTGPPVSSEEAKKIQAANQEIARRRITKELRSELRGLTLTIIGTFIWSYGAYL